MTLNQIYYFCAVAKSKNFRAAANKIHISQPSLSRSIAALEEELGINLFDKQGRGVVLTKAGKIFLEDAQNILRQCDIANTHIYEFVHGTGRIDIGYVFPLAGEYIPTHVRNFLNIPGNEGITFGFWQNYTPEIIEKLRDGSLDVGFGGCVDRMDLNFYPLFNQELIIVTSVDHPLAAMDEIPLEELENYPVIGYDRSSWMGKHTLSLYEKFELEPNIVVEAPDEYGILSLVRQNFGIAIIPRTDILKDFKHVKIHPIKDHKLGHQIFMFWMKEREVVPAVEHFIEYMKAQASDANDNKDVSNVYLKDIIHLD